MDEFLDWLGAQWGSLVGVVGVVTGFLFYWWSRRPKKFGWQIMNQTPILSTGSGHLPLKVVFDGQDVSSPYITQVRLGNTGKIELKADDFDGPVRISFNNSVILQVRNSGRSSEAINPALSKPASSKSISFTPTLLNQGEWIEYQLIMDGELETPEIYARVAGHGSASVDSLAQRTKRLEAAGLGMFFGGMVLVLVGI